MRFTAAVSTLALVGSSIAFSGDWDAESSNFLARRSAEAAAIADYEGVFDNARLYRRGPLAQGGNTVDFQAQNDQATFTGQQAATAVAKSTTAELNKKHTVIRPDKAILNFWGKNKAAAQTQFNKITSAIGGKKLGKNRS